MKLWFWRFFCFRNVPHGGTTGCYGICLDAVNGIARCVVFVRTGDMRGLVAVKNFTMLASYCLFYAVDKTLPHDVIPVI